MTIEQVGWTYYPGDFVGPMRQQCAWRGLAPGCFRAPEEHHLVTGHAYVEPPAAPTDAELAHASVVTEWTCPHCGHENDVHGEGALYSWMDCGGCPKATYLISEYDDGFPTAPPPSTARR